MLFNTYQGAVEYLRQINSELVGEQKRPLSRIQTSLIAFLLTGMIVTSSLNFALFSRLSLNSVTERSMSWLFHHAKVPWKALLRMNACILLRTFHIHSARLVLDDSTRKRAKNTEKLYGVHKVKDTKTNGYIMGQEFVVLLLVSDSVTIPIDVGIYQPDPKMKEWRKKDKLLRKQGVAKQNRPKQPEENPHYPSKEKIGRSLMSRFRYDHPTLEIRSILFDNGYLTEFLVAHARRTFPQAQIISRMKKTQLIQIGQRRGVAVENFFQRRGGHVVDISIRGDKKQTIAIKNCRAYVPSLKRKCHVVAIRYLEDKEYRFLVATDLSWTAESICREFGFRWLIEVAFEDWKAYDGIGRFAFQRGVDGVGCVLTLSFLVDGLLLTHPEQLACAASNQPLRTAGSIVRRIQKELLIQFVEELIYGENPREALERLKCLSEFLVSERLSDKHMSGHNIERNRGSPAV